MIEIIKIPGDNNFQEASCNINHVSVCSYLYFVGVLCFVDLILDSKKVIYFCGLVFLRISTVAYNEIF